jgi:hypothetical protein
VGASQVVLFIPDLNREGDPIDQQFWIEESLRVMGKYSGARPLFRQAAGFGEMMRLAKDCSKNRP